MCYFTFLICTVIGFFVIVLAHFPFSMLLLISIICLVGDEKVVYAVNELEAIRVLNRLDSPSIKPENDFIKATNCGANNFKPKTYGMYVEICHLCGNKSSHNCHTNICIKVIQCFTRYCALVVSGLHNIR